MSGESALGKLVASVVLDAAQFFDATEKAKVAAASMGASVDKALSDLSSKAIRSMESLASAVVAGFSVKAVYDMGTAALDTSEKLEQAAQKAGQSVEQFSALNFAAKQSGVSIDTLTSVSKKLSVAISDTAAGGTTYAQVFKALGITVDQSSTTSEGFNKVLLQVADTFAKSEDGPNKVAAAVKLLGRNGEDAIPLLNKGGAAIQAMEERAKSLGLVLDSDTAEKIKQFNSDLSILTDRSTVLAKLLAADLVPSLDSVVRAFIDGRTEGGLYEGAIRAMTEAFVQLETVRKNSGLVQELTDINTEIDRLNKGRGTITEALVGGKDYTDSQIDQLTARRFQIQQQLNVQGVADQSAALLRGRRGKIPDVGGAAAAGGSDVSGAAALSLADSLGKEDAALTANLDSLTKYGVATKETTLATTLFEVTEGKIAQNLQIGNPILAWRTIAMGAMAIADAADIDQKKNLIEIETRYIATVKQENDARAAAVQNAVDQVQGEKDAIATYGMTADAITRYKVAQLEGNIAQLQGVEGTDDAVKAMQLQVDKLNQLAKLQGVYQDIANTSKVWDQLSTAAGTFFGNLVTQGRGAFDTLRNSLKSFLADLIALFAKRFVLNIVAAATGSSALGAAAAGAGQGTAAGALGSALSSGVSSLLTPILAGSSAGFVGGGIGSEFIAGVSGGIVPGMGIVGEIGAALGPIGLAIAGLAAAVALFARSGGGPKSGGSFYGNFDTSGTYTGGANVPGTDNGRFFTPSDSDSSLATIGKGEASTYAKIAAALGITAGAFSFGLGFDTDPHGTAANRVSGEVVDSSGRVVFNDRDRDIGRDSTQIQPQLQLEASRAVVAAIKDSSLPGYLAKIFDSFDETTATQDQINALESQAEALSTIMDVATKNPLADVAQAVEDSQNQFQAAIKSNNAAIQSAIDSYDGSADAATNLASATQSYYSAQLQLLEGIEQAKSAIDDMFGTTFRNIKLAGLDTQGKYNFYQQDAQALEQQALNSSDPATIQRLAQQIDQDLEAAFNLLTPEQQAADGGQFIAQGTAAQNALDARLTQIQQTAANSTQAMLNKIADLLGGPTGSMQDAANKQVDAANKQVTAATTPRKIIIVDSRGQQLSVIPG